jgi:putative NADH-flavin reductase
MHFLVLGASGRTGQLIIFSALSKNHTVTALVRDPSSLTPSPGLTITTGSPIIKQDIERAITSSTSRPDAIIIALASKRKTDSPFSEPTSPPRLLTDAATNSLEAMSAYKIKKLVIISAFGVGDSNPSVWWPMRLVLNKSQMAFAFEDHNSVEEVVRNSTGVEWTLVRPVMLSDGDESEVTVFGDQGEAVGYVPKVSRASVAGFVVRVAGSESGEWSGRTPVIAN